MKRALLFGLALLVIVLSLPIMGPMAEMADCPVCAPTGPSIWMGCLAILALLVMVVPTGSFRRGIGDRIPPELLVAARLERPPRDI